MCVYVVCVHANGAVETRGANEVAQGEAEDAGTPTLFVREANDDYLRPVAPR